jgi:hypothetical protein
MSALYISSLFFNTMPFIKVIFLSLCNVFVSESIRVYRTIRSPKTLPKCFPRPGFCDWVFETKDIIHGKSQIESSNVQDPIIFSLYRYMYYALFRQTGQAFCVAGSEQQQ